ncbi:MAG: CopG family transcriptional regulator [Acidobacteria bacterium]|nr:CopG family transcriptional regulator [Acidobacteriota bacterium]
MTTRLTIALPDEVHAALKETAARRKRTIGEIITDSLVQYGIKSDEQAGAIVARARRAANLSPSRANAVAARETATHRGR